MEETTTGNSVFKKIDRAIFEQIDVFKRTPNYNSVQDFYNSLEEDQQKLFKASIIASYLLVPALLLGFLLWGNESLKEDLHLRVSLVSKANEIIGQNQGIREVSPQVLSPSPIDSESMMTSRISNVFSGIGVDLSKIKVSNFASESISSTILRSEADFGFTGVTTDELMNIFTNLIQREKFRIQSVDIKRSTDTELLGGQFHVIHYSSVAAAEEE